MHVVVTARHVVTAMHIVVTAGYVVTAMHVVVTAGHVVTAVVHGDAVALRVEISLLLCVVRPQKVLRLENLTDVLWP